MLNVSYSTMAQHLGVNPLTGEACAFSMRMLCDLNEDGVSLMAEYLGIPTPAAFAPPWNSTVAGKPAVASIMLARDAFPALVHFALMRMGCQYVYGRDDSVDSSGFSDSDLAEYPDLKDYIDGSARRAGFDQGARLYRNPSGAQPRQGTRNVHAFTGRAA